MRGGNAAAAPTPPSLLRSNGGTRPLVRGAPTCAAAPACRGYQLEVAASARRRPSVPPVHAGSHVRRPHSKSNNSSANTWIARPRCSATSVGRASLVHWCVGARFDTTIWLRCGAPLPRTPHSVSRGSDIWWRRPTGMQPPHTGLSQRRTAVTLLAAWVINIVALSYISVRTCGEASFPCSISGTQTAVTIGTLAAMGVACGWKRSAHHVERDVVTTHGATTIANTHRPAAPQQ